jgi:non-specific protein-tyrosine kinase
LPSSPKPIQNGLIALGIGLILGGGLVFLRAYLDRSIRATADLERAAPDLPVLGVIPSLQDWKAKSRPRVVSVQHQPTSPAAEAYRSLRTSIQFLNVERPVSRLQITSSSAGEGKSTTVANLGVAMSRAGQHVVIVSCDLRRPRIHEFFGVSNAVGLTSVILGDVSLSDAMQPVQNEEGLTVLASGPKPPNPSELLNSSHTRVLLDSVAASADVMLLDCSPVMPVTDAVLLSSAVDATVVVVGAGQTASKDLTRCLKTLRQVNAPLVGTVLNQLKAKEDYGYSYSEQDITSGHDFSGTYRPSSAFSGVDNGRSQREGAI